MILCANPAAQFQSYQEEIEAAGAIPVLQDVELSMEMADRVVATAKGVK